MTSEFPQHDDSLDGTGDPMGETSAAQDPVAARADVLVEARSIAGLAAALECASVGLQVRVLLPHRAGLAPLGPVRDSVGGLRELAGELGDALPTLARVPEAHPLVRAKNGALRPVPAGSVFGIPSSPLAKDVSALIGPGGAFRAYLDRIRPVLTIGKERFLGPLVRSRLGSAVERTMVDPLIRERFGAGVDAVEVAVAVPGLNEALTRTGSLSGAVLDIAEDAVARETPLRPVGGWPDFVSALFARLEFFRAEVHDAEVLSATENPDVRYRWTVEDSAGGRHLARALVVEADPVRSASSGESGHALRAYAEFSMAPAALAADAEQALASGGVVIETVSGGDGEPWSLRLEAGSPLRVRAAGPARQAGAEAGSVPTAGDLAALLASSDLVAGSLTAAHLTGFRGWVELASEPTREAEQAREATLPGLRAERPERLVIGESVSGPGLSAALRDARAAAVPLRRRLAGIA